MEQRLSLPRLVGMRGIAATVFGLGLLALDPRLASPYWWY